MPADPITLLGISILVLILFLPLLTRRRARRSVGSELRHIKPDWIAGSQDHPILLYITTPTCGICRSITPWVTHWAEQDWRVHVINAMEEPALMRELGVMGTPTFVVLRHGRVADVQVGAKSEKQIRAWLAKFGDDNRSDSASGGESGAVEIGGGRHHDGHPGAHHDSHNGGHDGGGDGGGGD